MVCSENKKIRSLFAKVANCVIKDIENGKDTQEHAIKTLNDFLSEKNKEVQNGKFEEEAKRLICALIKLIQMNKKRK